MISPILTLWSRGRKRKVCCYTNFTYSHLISKPCDSSCCFSTSHFLLQPVGFLQRGDNGQVKWESWFSRLFSFCSNLQKIVKRQAKLHITERFVVMGEKMNKQNYFILVIPYIFDGNSLLVLWILIKVPFKKTKRIFVFISDRTSYFTCVNFYVSARILFYCIKQKTKIKEVLNNYKVMLFHIKVI